MICSKCGSEISEGSMFCDECGANVEYVREKKATATDLIRNADLPAKAKSAQGKINPVVIGVIIFVIIFVISLGSLISNVSDSRDSIEMISSALSGSLTGKYGWYGDSSSKYQWSISFNNDETCLVIYREYEYYSATYDKNSDGTYTIHIPDIQDTWVASKNGDDLEVKAGRFGTQTFEKIG